VSQVDDVPAPDLESAAAKTDPASGFEIERPTPDELDDDDGYVAADGTPQPSGEDSFDEPELAHQEGLNEGLMEDVEDPGQAAEGGT
jgi:hypothetical protein